MERPILFNGPMVNAILAGKKTQTRRVLKVQPLPLGNGWMQYDSRVTWHAPTFQSESGTAPITHHCPYGAPGDSLWVRETFAIHEVGESTHIVYRADCGSDGDGAKWKPSIFMPRKHSRIALKITDVRVERLQEIRDKDALAEGVPQVGSIDVTGITTGETVENFAALWDSINAKRGHSWGSNPWVWVIKFEKI